MDKVKGDYPIGCGRKIPDILKGVPLKINVIEPWTSHRIDFARDARLSQFAHLSDSDQALALYLLQEAKKLVKVCPECEGKKYIIKISYGCKKNMEGCIDPPKHCVNEDGETCTFETQTEHKTICPTCHGTGHLPVEAGDVVVKPREE